MIRACGVRCCICLLSRNPSRQGAFIPFNVYPKDIWCCDQDLLRLPQVTRHAKLWYRGIQRYHIRQAKFSKEPLLVFFPLQPSADMEELQRHRGSRKGYRSHLTRLTTSANELMATNIEDIPEENVKTAAALDSILGQLKRKEKLLADLDTKILALVRDENELEAEVFEAEEIQSKIAEMVSNIKSFTARLLHRGDKVHQLKSSAHPES